MSDRPSYLVAAFNARPFGMPVPPNWFALAAFGLLGGLVNPGFWLIGAGLEVAYLWALSRNRRFRRALDAAKVAASEPDWVARYQALTDRLDESAERVQAAMEVEVTDIASLLERSGASETQIADVRQLAWLHLKLLATRCALMKVIARAAEEQRDLETQERHIGARLAVSGIDPDLARSLEQQLAVIRSRRAAHTAADQRRELVDAELERLRHQISLVREQALLATDEGAVVRSLDVVTASLNEANRWLKDQRELFAGLEDLADEPPPPELLKRKSSRKRRARKEESA